MEQEIERTAKGAAFSMGQIVEWRGRHYRIVGVYWRPLRNLFRYDLDEVVEEGPGRFQKKRGEAELKLVSEQ